MNQYIINFKNTKNKEEFYNAIIKGMDFPKWCGHNPDAIWDMLTGHSKYPAVIKVVGGEELSENLKEEYAALKEVFKKLEEYGVNAKFKVQNDNPSF